MSVTLDHHVGLRFVDACLEQLNEPTDGRLARSHRTTGRLTNALLQLIDAGEMRPTVAMVAEAAAVSRRTFYLHFNRVEEVLAAAIDQRLSELSGAWQPFCPLGTLHERAALFCAQRCAILEQLARPRRAIALYDAMCPELASAVERIRRWLAESVEFAFMPDLAYVGPEDFDRVTAALHCITSGSVWDQLRCDSASIEEASSVMAHLVTAYLTTAVASGGGDLWFQRAC